MKLVIRTVLALTIVASVVPASADRIPPEATCVPLTNGVLAIPSHIDTENQNGVIQTCTYTAAGPGTVNGYMTSFWRITVVRGGATVELAKCIGAACNPTTWHNAQLPIATRAGEVVTVNLISNCGIPTECWLGALAVQG